jgi:hypothetical protein
MAAYTGQVVTWEEAMQSTEQLVPDHFEWGAAPSHPLPRPGVTRLV